MSETKAEEKKWDLKQLGAGGGSVLAILFLMQEKGIDLMSSKNLAENRVVVEKTIANAERINKLETNVSRLNVKIDNGFDSIRTQIKNDTDKISDIVRAASSDRFTKAEHINYRGSMNNHLARLQDQINDMRDRCPVKKSRED